MSWLRPWLRGMQRRPTVESGRFVFSCRPRVLSWQNRDKIVDMNQVIYVRIIKRQRVVEIKLHSLLRMNWPPEWVAELVRAVHPAHSTRGDLPVINSIGRQCSASLKRAAYPTVVNTSGSLRLAGGQAVLIYSIFCLEKTDLIRLSSIFQLPVAFPLFCRGLSLSVTWIHGKRSQNIPAEILIPESTPKYTCRGQKVCARASRFSGSCLGAHLLV